MLKSPDLYQSLIEILKSMESKSGIKLIGFYEQGSGILGYSDNFSDMDFIVLWENQLPNKSDREQIISVKSNIVHEIKDVDFIGSNFDLFEILEKRVNLCHKTFKSKFEKINNKTDFSKDHLLDIYSFKKATIHLDPYDVICKLQNSIVLNGDQLKNFRQNAVKKVEYLLQSIIVASERKATIHYLYDLAEILDYLSAIWLIDSKKQLISYKWYQKEVKDNELKMIYDSFDFNQLTEKILKYTKRLDIHPSKKLKA